MAKIARIYQKPFGSSAPSAGSKGCIGKFGSLAAGTPTGSTDPSVIQALGAWANGWLSAILGDNGPAIEDMNGLFFVAFYQIGYLLQQGIPEWDTTTVYYIGSLVNNGGVIYQSIVDNNSGNALTDGTKWQPFGQKYNTTAITTDTTIDDTYDYWRVDASGGPVTMTLPALGSSLNKKKKIKKIDSSANIVTVKGNGTDSIDGVANTYELGAQGESIEVLAVSTVWDIQ